MHKKQSVQDLGPNCCTASKICKRRPPSQSPHPPLPKKWHPCGGRGQNRKNSFGDHFESQKDDFTKVGYLISPTGVCYRLPLWGLRPCPSYSGHRGRIGLGPNLIRYQM